MVVRIWDSFWLRGFPFLYCVALSIFKVTQDVIVTFDMDELMGFLKFKDGPKPLYFDTEQLLSCALHLFTKIKPTEIREYENAAKEQFQDKLAVPPPAQQQPVTEKVDKKKSKPLLQISTTPRSFAKMLATKSDKKVTAIEIPQEQSPSNSNEDIALSARSYRDRKKKKARRLSDPPEPELDQGSDKNPQQEAGGDQDSPSHRDRKKKPSKPKKRT